MLKTVSKNYKQVISKNIRRHKNTTIEKLRRVKSKDPKEYWRIINNDNKRAGSTIPVDDFSNILKTSIIQLQIRKTNHFLSNETINENHEINMPISENEIRQAAKNLKRNKSPGFDKILNEHLLITLDCIPAYHTFW